MLNVSAGGTKEYATTANSPAMAVTLAGTV